METNSHTEEPKTDWNADFTISEPLHGAAATISGTFSRLSINFPENPLVKNWDKEANKWHQYYKNIGDLKFHSHEEGEAEIDRVSQVCKSVLSLEKELKQKSN